MKKLLASFRKVFSWSSTYDERVLTLFKTFCYTILTGICLVLLCFVLTYCFKDNVQLNVPMSIISIATGMYVCSTGPYIVGRMAELFKKQSVIFFEITITINFLLIVACNVSYSYNKVEDTLFYIPAAGILACSLCFISVSIVGILLKSMEWNSRPLTNG